MSRPDGQRSRPPTTAPLTGCDGALRPVPAWRVPPRAFRRITGVAVWALAFIIVSGAAVRLTGSGLGCTDWPKCTATRWSRPWQFHAWVEFGNRLINAGWSSSPSCWPSPAPCSGSAGAGT